MSEYVDAMIFAGLVGASLARSRYGDLWYRDGTQKTEVDLMRVPWIRNHIRREQQERLAWRKARAVR